METECVLCGVYDETLVGKHVGSKSGIVKAVDNVLCNGCGLIFNDPIPTQEKLDEYYQEEFNKLVHGHTGEDLLEFFKGKAKRKREIARMTYGFFADELPGDPQILEIGSGAGFLLHELRVYHPLGLEPNHDLFDVDEKLHNNHTENVSFLDFETNTQYDLIIMQHVFEHVAAPHHWLDKVSTHLKDDGLVYIALPIASDFKPSRNLMDNMEYGHLYHYNPYTLGMMMWLHGYEQIKSEFDYALSYQALFRKTEHPKRNFPDITPEQQKKILRNHWKKHLWWRIKRKLAHVSATQEKLA